MTSPTGILKAFDWISSISYQLSEKDLERQKVSRNIDLIARNILSLSPQQLKALPDTVRVEIIDRALEGHKMESIREYLDDVACSRLVSNEKHLPQMQQFYVNYCADTKTVSVNSSALGSQEIHRFLKELGPEIKAEARNMDLSSCFHLENLDSLREFPSLESLNLSHCENLKCLKGITGSVKLKKLQMERCFKVRDFKALKGLYLEDLIARRCTVLNNIEGIAGHPLLKLDLSLCLSLEMHNLDVLVSLKGTLKELDISGLPRMTSLGKIVPLKNLEILYIEGTGIEDVSDLSKFPKLNRKIITM